MVFFFWTVRKTHGPKVFVDIIRANGGELILGEQVSIFDVGGIFQNFLKGFPDCFLLNPVECQSLSLDGDKHVHDDGNFLWVCHKNSFYS